MKRAPQVGSFIEISLGKNQYAYARIISKGLFSFYKIENRDCKKKKEEIIELIRASNPIFNIYLHKDVYKTDNWLVIGYSPLEEKILNNMPVFFRQDIINKEVCWLITVKVGPDYRKPLRKEECIGMEREVSWDNVEHVEGRLRDYLANRTNVWVERYKVKL